MLKSRFGIEIEFTGITKDEATRIVANHLNGRIEHVFDGYSTRKIYQQDGRAWKIMNDGSIKCQRKLNGVKMAASTDIEDDPELETIKAKRKIAKYIELHDTNIAQKVEIIIEHFKNRIMKELDHKAKAMVVTSSRQAAVKYLNEFERYIFKHGYTGIRALVAFSGKITLDGKEYTESVMNSLSETELPEAFDSDNYHVLLVANKYQTGFNQPKLCAMYIDKKLRGVNAVQTLSRLNRICNPYDKKHLYLILKMNIMTYKTLLHHFILKLF